MIRVKMFKTDKFNVLKIEEKALYMLLLLNADENGNVYNPLELLKTLDIKQDVLDELLIKKFVINISESTLYIVSDLLIKED